MGLFDRRAKQVPPSRRPPRYGVLLVDDEILNLTSLAGLLEDDYRVHLASSPEDALRMLADPALADSIHVILSDQRMPGMSGVELLARARTLRPDAKRLLLTGYSDVDAIVGAINEAAIWKYLRKPIDSQELRLTLARACETWQLERDNEGLLGELQQAFRRLQALDADKLAFLRYLAHEMNTPLNWLAATQVIDRDRLAPETREILACVDQGQERLHGLVQAVLRYFHVAGMEQPVRVASLDLAVLMTRQISRLREQVGDSLALQVEQPVTLTLDTDPALLAELLAHLLENAATHARRSRAAPAEVRVGVRQEDRSVAISVTNSGENPGEEALASLFRPFFFCGAAHGAEGYGLSLATAHALASALGGRLEASLPAAPGLCLTLTLPLALPPQPPVPLLTA